MEETKIETTQSTRGRKPNSAKTTVTVENPSMDESVVELIRTLQMQISELKTELDKSKKETQTLKNNSANTEKNLAKKVKIISLLPNAYNLSTEENGRGRLFRFEGFGDMITIKTSELEDILSIQAYRKQAEEGYFYILDKDIVEDQDLSEAYENIQNKEAIEHLMKLDSDECVEIFCGLNAEMQSDYASKMAEDLNKGIRLDRNRMAEIARRTEIDIEKIAESFKKAINKDNK